MKSALRVILLLISAAAAFVFLTVNVGTKDVGGITGTIVVAPGVFFKGIRLSLILSELACFDKFLCF